MGLTVPTVQSGTTNTGNSTDGTSKTAVDYQSFLRLLVAEMKNQDPTKPMDSTQYVAQLASFSQVEQSVQINSKLNDLLTSQTLSQADALIGRTITSADGTVTGEVASVKLYSDGIIATLKDGSQIVIGPGITVQPTPVEA
ncbi:flagellar basal body rod modification protein [Mesorhizobium soli]|uniref:Basal-body rod modification protein FlgD n=1 Tax=Pseudaminobacter soli (ex Li et al. 2025) TaxID=1295366 RepID=A0A2P7SDW5_9HYPH|nr:flagellar hook assembly protein FlgD [Mesorhizobium soli]PSJ60706.1 flagellar basal body rod modification protein [Mesorhizobium soli]